MNEGEAPSDTPVRVHGTLSPNARLAGCGAPVWGTPTLRLRAMLRERPRQRREAWGFSVATLPLSAESDSVVLLRY